MPPADERPQSTLGALGKIAAAALILGILRAARMSSGVDVVWEPDAFYLGAFLGLILVASEYYRTPASRRLAPVPTMAIGLTSLAVVLTALRSAPRPMAELGWLGWLSIAVMICGPLYLLVAGARDLRRGRGAVA